MQTNWRGGLVRFARRIRRYVPQEVYRSLYGWGRLGYLPNYRQPRTFNEKVTWWVRRHRDPRLTQRADKLGVREFVAAVAPWVRIPEVYAVSDDAASFPFERLPDVSVLKSNHGWHQVQVLRRPFDYKVLVLNGRAAYVSVFVRSEDRLRRITFDRDWRVLPIHLPVHEGGPPDVVEREFHPPRPRQLDELVRAAEDLAEDIPCVRADFYLIDDEIYFGELTYFPAGGYAPFWPPAVDRQLGDLLDVGSPRPWWAAGR